MRLVPSWIKKDCSQTGFTLVELLILAAAGSVIATILVAIMIQGNGLFLNQSSQISESLSLNNSSDQIQKTIKSAQSVIANFVNGTNNFTTNSTTLVLNVPSINTQGVIIDSKFDVMIISPDPAKPNLLKRFTFPDPSSSRKVENLLLATNLSRIQFSYLNDAGSVVSPTTATRIDFLINLAEKSGLGMKESSLSGRVNLKNN